jgi:hypothetical protein
MEMSQCFHASKVASYQRCGVYCSATKRWQEFLDLSWEMFACFLEPCKSPMPCWEIARPPRLIDCMRSCVTNGVQGMHRSIAAFQDASHG